MRYHAPSLIIEKIIGLKVHDTWGLENHEDLQAELRENIPNNLFGYKESVVDRIFPMLHFPNYDDPITRFHVVFGAISQFNRDDIEFFINIPTDARPTEYILQKSILETKLQTQLHWIPSPKTIDKINSYLN
jgi:hypothetical protein